MGWLVFAVYSNKQILHFFHLLEELRLPLLQVCADPVNYSFLNEFNGRLLAFFRPDYAFLNNLTCFVLFRVRQRSDNV